MGRKPSINSNPSRKELKTIKSSTPLQQKEDTLSVGDIIKSDDMMFKVHFMSRMMIEHRTRQEIQTLYKEKFGKDIGYDGIKSLKERVRALYIAETIRTRDEMVADELMQAEWELRELKDYWERSKRSKRKVVRHKANSVGTELTTYNLDEDTETIEETNGDLNAMKCINSVRERVIRILGLEAPKQQPAEQNKPNTITINIVDAPKRIDVQDIQPTEEIKN